MSGWTARKLAEPYAKYTPWLAGIPAQLLCILGLLNLVWAIFPSFSAWLAAVDRFSPLFFPALGRSFNFLFGLALVLIAGGLRRRKQYAWWAGVTITGLVFTIRLVLVQSNWVSVLLAGGFAIWLLFSRRIYTAGSNPVAVQRGLQVWMLLLLGALAAGVFGFGQSLSSTLIGGLLQAGGRAVMLFGLFYDPGGDPEMLLVSSAIFAMGVFAWGRLLFALDGPLPQPSIASAEDRLRARQIVREYGRTSQAHLTLLDDKNYFFSPGGSMLAYTVCKRVALTLGDPIGPAEDAAAAAAAFVDFCTHHDWLPAFCLTTGDYLDHYRRLGFKHMCLGHEGIVDLHSFTLRGNNTRTIRKRYNRLSTQGYRLEILDPPIAENHLRDLSRISDEWLKMASAAEKRFFLAWFDVDYVRNERIAVVRSPSGEICAFTNLVPEYQLNEVSIDLMRRRQVESGTMDFMFVSLFLWAREQGFDTFNLGLSPLFGVGDRPDVPLLERAINLLYCHGNFYDFKGLNGFKIKFRPTWVPQYLVYPGLFSLGWVGLAMARVNAGTDETLWKYFRPRSKQTPIPELDEQPQLLPDVHGD